MKQTDWAYKLAKRATSNHDASWCHSLTVEEAAKLLKTERTRILRGLRKLVDQRLTYLYEHTARDTDEIERDEVVVQLRKAVTIVRGKT